MKITSKLMKVNQSLELPQRESQSLPTTKTESCVVFKYVFFQMAQIAWNVCKDLNAKPLETARRGEMRNGGSGGPHRPAVCTRPWSPL